MKFVSTLTALVAMFLAGCGQTLEPASNPPPDDGVPGRQAVEESDLYRIDGRFLYVQNPVSGLNVIDMTDPARPALVGQAPVTGRAGELYLHRGHAIVLFKSASASCTALSGGEEVSFAGAEIAVVNVRTPAAPRLLSRYCLRGDLVTSRMVGDYLIAVTNLPESGVARATSLDLAAPSQPWVVRELDFAGASREVHVTETALYAAQASGDRTRVQYVEISGVDGWMRLRGDLEVPGLPQGRFHMDASGAHFRIVTYEAQRLASRLSVIDVRDPDRLRLVGSLAGIGHGERLFATRFDKDRAYVVTYRVTDPLWVISLADPSFPVQVGELHVPGWSDFIFPRGDRLLAVGRGDRGRGVQVSLFDVSDPASPRALSQVAFGGAQTSSEANFDHRAITVVEEGESGGFVVVPYSGATGGGCLRDVVQFVDLTPEGLGVRGYAMQSGLIRRSFATDGSLVSISDAEVVALDIADRDRPTPTGSVTMATCEAATGALSQSIEESAAPLDTPSRRRFRLFCSSTGAAPAALPALLIVGALLIARRRRRRC